MNPPTELVRARAVELAAAGAWEQVELLLRDGGDHAREHAELGALRGEALLRLGQPREAQRWIEELLPSIALAGDRAALRRATNLLGAACFETGALDAAEAAFERALQLAWADGDDLLIARANNNLGAIANVRGNRTLALALYRLAIPAYQRLGSSGGLALSCHNIAITLRDLDRLDDADEYERRAIEFAREAESPGVAALARLGRAELSLRRGDAALAEAAARNAAAEFARLGDPIRECDALRLAGEACLALARLPEADVALGQALGLARAHGAALNEAETLRARARLAAASGDQAAVRADGEAALALFASLGARTEVEALRAWLRATGGEAA